MRKVNKWIGVGISLYVVLLMINQFVGIPDPIYGLGMGVAVGLELYGLLASKIDLKNSKVRAFKMRILNKCLGK